MALAAAAAPGPTDELTADRPARSVGLLRGLLSDPRTHLTALDGAGFRAAWPTAVAVPEGRLIPVPTERTTMLNLVTPADWMRVVAAWDQAAASGYAIADVHPVAEPLRLLRLTVLDARGPIGVWIGALTEAGQVLGEPTGPPPGSLAVRLGTRSAVIDKNARGIITAIDDRVTRMLGWVPTELIGARSTAFIHHDDIDRVLASWIEMLSTGQPQRVRCRHRCADGSWLWVEAENSPTMTSEAADSNTRVATHLSDISEEMAAHEAVAGRERLFRRLTEALPVGVLRIDSEQTIAYANPAITTMIGVFAGATMHSLLGLIPSPDRGTLSAAVQAALETGTDGQVEISVDPVGAAAARRCIVSLIALSDLDSESGALACVQDITDSARVRDALTVRATRDPLTGCHNRASVSAALEQALATAPAGSTAVVFVDLDHFKAINDELGHAAGDELLVHVAMVLSTISRPHDLVGRIGGDEFLLLLTDIDGPGLAVKVAERAAEALRRPVVLAGQTVLPSASLGVACARPTDTAKTLTARADDAMYASKAERAGRPHLETPPSPT